MGKIFQALQKAEKDREKRRKSGIEDVEFDSADGELDPHLVAYYDRMSPISEQYRLLRSAVLAVNPESPPKSVCVTSAVAGEGKTLTCLNLGVTFAENQDTRVVIVDANMREPGIHNGIGVDNQRGLSDFLSGNVMLELILQRTRHPNLWILPAGGLPGDPSQMLSETRMRDLVVRLSRDFGFVLIDTPDLQSTPDAGAVAAWTDGTLLVVRSGDTSRALAVSALEALHEVPAKVFGTVVTHLPPVVGGYDQPARN